MHSRRNALAYYITPHGFGHAVRSLEIIRYLQLLASDLDIILISAIPDFLVEQNLGKPVPYRKERLDIGLIQNNNLQYDLKESLAALEKLRDGHNALVAKEVQFLKSENITTVVSDIPFLAFYAAFECGIPSVGIGNFTWDWIYGAFAASDPDWNPIISWIREGYSRADLLLQLPMHGDCSACPHILDVPLVAGRAVRGPEETRTILGCPPEIKLYLVSFTDLDLDTKALGRISQIKDALFLFKHPLHYELSNGMSLDPLDLTYTDVVATANAVITKPGYGIVSDCLAHGTPVIYTDRGLFHEYEVLVQAIEQSLTTVYIPSSDLYSGAWEQAIKKIESLPRRAPQIRTDGAKICARHILEKMQ
ncbi:MAG: hypothetical protein AB2L11_02965 [Syntrophobacteraceae bacterium]